MSSHPEVALTKTNKWFERHLARDQDGRLKKDKYGNPYFETQFFARTLPVFARTLPAEVTLTDPHPGGRP